MNTLCVSDSIWPSDCKSIQGCNFITIYMNSCYEFKTVLILIKTVLILISWPHQKPADLDLHSF